ncbi:MAG: LytB protein, partial [Proteobacteria bacterium]|nr:LytB protein [Pseudomonadota bacterium]
MQTRSNYLIAAFVSFMIHASIILYLTDFFYFEKQKRPV